MNPSLPNTCTNCLNNSCYTTIIIPQSIYLSIYIYLSISSNCKTNRTYFKFSRSSIWNGSNTGHLFPKP